MCHSYYHYHAICSRVKSKKLRGKGYSFVCFGREIVFLVEFEIPVVGRGIQIGATLQPRCCVDFPIFPPVGDKLEGILIRYLTSFIDDFAILC